MANDTAGNIMADILNQCDTDPDSALELLDRLQSAKPELESDAFMLFARAMGWASKGLYSLLRKKTTVNILTADVNDLRDELGVEASHLAYLEKSLSYIKQLDDHHPGSLSAFEHDNGDRRGELKVDGVAVVVEAFHPGRVQEILGRTKLRYFGASRIKVFNDCITSSEDFDIAGDVWISLGEIARTALIMKVGTTQESARYVHVIFFRGLDSDIGPDDSLFALGKISDLFIFEDGSTALTIPEEEEEKRRAREVSEAYKRMVSEPRKRRGLFGRKK